MIELESYRGSGLRYVEKQSRITTSELVANEAEQLRLEELLEENKPVLAPDTGHLHWLLRSPFRYPPLEYGSRFGRIIERGILYLSETREALEAEAAFYAFKFFEDMLEPPPEPIRREYTVLGIQVQTPAMVDTTVLPDCWDLSDPKSWTASQSFGSKAREQGAAGLRYFSARISPDRALAEQHCNLAIFEPTAVLGNQPPQSVDSYATLIDQTGVRIQGIFGETSYFKADLLADRPFP